MRNLMITTCVYVTLVAIAVTYLAEDGAPRHYGPATEHMVRVLDDAGFPLEQHQIAQLDRLERGEFTRGNLAVILNNGQLGALDESMKYGTFARAHSGHAMLTAILAHGGQPLTEVQSEEIATLSPVPGNREKLLAILNQEQRTVLSDMLSKRFSAPRRVSEWNQPL